MTPLHVWEFVTEAVAADGFSPGVRRLKVHGGWLHACPVVTHRLHW